MSDCETLVVVVGLLGTSLWLGWRPTKELVKKPYPLRYDAGPLSIDTVKAGRSLMDDIKEQLCPPDHIVVECDERWSYDAEKRGWNVYVKIKCMSRQHVPVELTGTVTL